MPGDGGPIVDADVYADQLLSEKEIAGAIRSCIDAHGPVSGQWVGSAAKRVRKALLTRSRLLRDGKVRLAEPPALDP